MNNKKLEKYNTYLELVNVKQLEEEIKTIKETVNYDEEAERLLKFFKMLYPDLEDINKYKKKEELLQIALFYISPKLNSKTLMGSKRGKIGVSNYGERSINFIQNEIKKYFYSTSANNVYYSLGLAHIYKKNKDYDPNPDSDDVKIDPSIKEKHIKPFRNNNSNTLYLGALAIDIDTQTEEELEENIKRCNEIEGKLNINSIKIRSSLTGEQRVYLLDKTYTDKDLLNQFMISFYEAGINLDTQIKDISRVLRMPIGLNVKAFNPVKNTEHIFKVRWLNEDEEIKRYSPEGLLEGLKYLKIRDFVETKSKKKRTSTKGKAQKSTRRQISKEEIGYIKENIIKLEKDEFQVYYENLDYEVIPESIIKMFSSHSIEGYRNKVLRVLNYYLDFMNPRSLTEKQKIFILSNWGRDVGLENREYQIKYIRENKQYLRPDNKEIVDVFGEIDLVSFSKSSYVYVNNYILNRLKYLRGDSFKLFLRILINEADNKVDTYTKDSLINITKISSRSMERYLNDLVVAELLIKRKAKLRKKGDKTEFYINPKYRDFNFGYERFRPSTIEKHLEELKQNELKLYYYLLLKSQEGIEFSKSKRDIAQDLEISHPSITGITNKLKELGYIKKTNNGKGFHQLNSYEVR